MQREKSLADELHEVELPPGVQAIVLDNGEWQFTMDTKVARLTCNYKPEVIKHALRALIDDLFQRREDATYQDVIVDSADGTARYLVEVKRANVEPPRVANLSDEELREERDKYLQKAWEHFRSTFHKDLKELPSVHLVISTVATIAALDMEGILITKAGATNLIDEVYEKLNELFKDQTPRKRRGRRRRLTPAQDKGYIKVYYATLKELQAIKEEIDAHSEKGEAAPVLMLKNKYPQIPEYIFEGLRFEPASAFAHRLAALRFGVPFGRYLEAALERERSKN